METWTWLVAYLIGFAVFQLLLYRYFQRGESTLDRADGREPGYKRLEQRAGASDVSYDDDTDGVYCQHCGTRNEQHGMVDYCRNCAEPLR